MKFIVPTPIRQYSHIQVVASKKLIGELLHVINGDFSPSAESWVALMKAPARLSYWSVCLSSGAKLSYEPETKKFYIYCYAYDGQDGLAAAEQLKFADSIRRARVQFAKMHKLMQTNKPPHVRILFDYGYGNHAAM